MPRPLDVAVGTRMSPDVAESPVPCPNTCHLDETDSFLGWEYLPLYDEDGDSYSGGRPPVEPPQEVPTVRWRDSRFYSDLFNDPNEAPEIPDWYRDNLRRGICGGRTYRLRCDSLRAYSWNPLSNIVVVGYTSLLTLA